MKKILTSLVVVLFLATLLGACQKPCVKAFDKWKDCQQKQGVPAKLIKRFDEKKDEFHKECKKKESKIKDCLKIADCKKFNRCMEKAM